MASEGITVPGGVIDLDYMGPIQGLLCNFTKTARRITKGEWICQALFLPVLEVEWIHGQLPTTLQNEGGLGSAD